MSDTCGAINATGAGDIDMGGTNGDHNCTTPTSGGNTAATRSGMYEVNKIFEEARGWLPNNQWLQGMDPGPLQTNMNLNQTCNAFYSGSINFYKSGGGCRNTGEIAAVFDHEWGHGLDDHDANGTLSSSSEGYADIASMFRLWASCVGYGFFQTANPGCGMTADGTGFNQDEAQQGALKCDLDCSGVRDADYLKIQGGTPLGASFMCASCLGGSGSCGRQVHCAGTATREAAWNFVARELQNPPGVSVDANTAFIIGDKVFYQGSGNVGLWHNCTCPSTSDGCNANGGYLNWLAADDDNGNLNDGTPHMEDIFAAFSSNGIACATPTPLNAGCAGGPTTAPAVNGTPGSSEITLDWTSVPGAVNYNVFRTEGYVTDGTDKCAFGKALIGSTASLTFTDTEVANGRAYSYVVMAEGSNDACFGPASNCTTVTPQGAACQNPPTITTTSLPNGTEGAAYNQMLQATGGTPPYTWSIIGSLPPGLSLDSATGVISGTADAGSAGTYNFTARVDDSQPNCFDTQDLSITINVAGACAYENDFNDTTQEWIEEKATVSQPGDGFLHLTPLKRKAITVADASFGAASAGTYTFVIQASGGVFAKNWMYITRVDKKNQLEILAKYDTGKLVVKDRFFAVLAKAKADFAFAPNTAYTVVVNYDGTNIDVSIDGTPLIVDFVPARSLPAANTGAAAKNDTLLIDNFCFE